MRWPTIDSVTRPITAVPLLWSAAFTVALAVAYAPQQWPLVDLYGFFDQARRSTGPGLWPMPLAAEENIDRCTCCS